MLLTREIEWDYGSQFVHIVMGGVKGPVHVTVHRFPGTFSLEDHRQLEASSPYERFVAREDIRIFLLSPYNSPCL